MQERHSPSLSRAFTSMFMKPSLMCNGGRKTNSQVFHLKYVLCLNGIILLDAAVYACNEISKNIKVSFIQS